jgi:hypothetical protein
VRDCVSSNAGTVVFAEPGQSIELTSPILCGLFVTHVLVRNVEGHDDGGGSGGDR